MYNVKKQDVKNYRMVKCTKSDQNRLMLQTFEEKVKNIFAMTNAIAYYYYYYYCY